MTSAIISLYSHTETISDTTEIKWVHHSQERCAHIVSVTGGKADIYFYERNTYDPWSTTIFPEEISWQGPACKRSDWKALSGYGDTGIGDNPTAILIYRSEGLSPIDLTTEYGY